MLVYVYEDGVSDDVNMFPEYASYEVDTTDFNKVRLQDGIPVVVSDEYLQQIVDRDRNNRASQMLEEYGDVEAQKAALRAKLEELENGDR